MSPQAGLHRLLSSFYFYSSLFLIHPAHTASFWKTGCQVWPTASVSSFPSHYFWVHVCAHVCPEVSTMGLTCALSRHIFFRRQQLLTERCDTKWDSLIHLQSTGRTSFIHKSAVWQTIRWSNRTPCKNGVFPFTCQGVLIYFSLLPTATVSYRWATTLPLHHTTPQFWHWFISPFSIIHYLPYNLKYDTVRNRRWVWPSFTHISLSPSPPLIHISFKRCIEIASFYSQ